MCLYNLFRIKIHYDLVVVCTMFIFVINYLYLLSHAKKDAEFVVFVGTSYPQTPQIRGFFIGA